jgi:rubrerythrin
MTMAMGVEEAIKTALEFEAKVRDVYAQEAARATDPAARRTLGTLAGEEQSHLNFLHAKLEEWKQSGRVTEERLATALPSAAALREGRKGLRQRMQLPAAERVRAEATLRRALAAEAEVGAFYRRVVGELPGPVQPLFARFLEIEDGHLAIVQAELDAVTGLGYWFDVQEFRLEAE